MLNKLRGFIRQYKMIRAGDTLICAVSGGADSMALLFAMYLLRDQLGFRLEAAHFNHCLRGAESDRDENFVRDFCAGYDIPLHVGKTEVKAGAKGLEAAARDARYAYLHSLSGKILTAHTADDNAETVLMHMVRGTGLNGLGGISPVSGNLLRPMLSVTRQEVLAFLEEYSIPYVEDSTNETEQFLRNRLRHQVMPLLKQENPRLAENVSAMALRLREDEQTLTHMAENTDFSVSQLREMEPAVRNRALRMYLMQCGVPEPESEHIALAESLVFSDNPSARGSFPGGITLIREYDRLVKWNVQPVASSQTLSCPGSVCMGGIMVVAEPLSAPAEGFCIAPQGEMVVRARESGDKMRLSGGTKSLKKLFIDRKIPENMRMQIPVIADELGVLGVYGIGPCLDRVATEGPCVKISFQKI